MLKGYMTYKELLFKYLPEIPNQNILCEPSPMNTTPAIYLALKFIEMQDSSATVGVYPADHYIKDVSTFHENINSIKEFINKKNINLDQNYFDLLFYFHLKQ